MHVYIYIYIYKDCRFLRLSKTSEVDRDRVVLNGPWVQRKGAREDHRRKETEILFNKHMQESPERTCGEKILAV